MFLGSVRNWAEAQMRRSRLYCALQFLLWRTTSWRVLSSQKNGGADVRGTLPKHDNGKPSETAGRKTTGLIPAEFQEKVAELPKGQIAMTPIFASILRNQIIRSNKPQSATRRPAPVASLVKEARS